MKIEWELTTSTHVTSTHIVKTIWEIFELLITIKFNIYL